jgi:ribonuclease VapC
MFVDASALLAIILREPEADDFADQLANGDDHHTSPMALFEVIVPLMSRKQLSRQAAETHVQIVLTAANISVVPITPEIGHLALEAFERYGKGRGHPAQLNMGDCFSYACARALGVPLLYKGEDFACTDIAAS